MKNSIKLPSTYQQKSIPGLYEYSKSLKADPNLNILTLDKIVAKSKHFPEH